MVFFSQGLSDQAKTFTGKESTPGPQKMLSLGIALFFFLQILVMAHPWSKNLQKLSWPQKNSMALQTVLPSMGLSIFSSIFLYVSYAPEGPSLHYSMTVWTNIHSFLCQHLLGTFSVHIQVWGAISHLCPPPLRFTQAQMLFVFSTSREIAIWRPLPLFW